MANITTPLIWKLCKKYAVLQHDSFGWIAWDTTNEPPGSDIFDMYHPDCTREIVSEEVAKSGYVVETRGENAKRLAFINDQPPPSA